MNEISTRKIKEYKEKSNQRRVVIISLIVAFIIILPLLFYFFTVKETLSFENLDKESYNSRMKDSFLYAFIMFECLILLFSPLIVIINNMFKRYLEFIKTLTINEAEKLLLINDREDFIYKYMPSYITKENTVTFFTIFGQNTLDFNDIISIDVRQVYYRGYRAKILINTRHNRYSYTLYGNSFKVINLLIEAIEVNPKIINNKRWI